MADFPVASQARHHLLLIVKEILHNIAKHAAATEVRLRIEIRGRHFEIEIKDNGVGFDPAAARPEGEGVANIRARVEELAGYCEIDSRPQAGTRVTVRIPLAALTSPTLPFGGEASRYENA